jgi:site-specific DNA recombinase
MRAVIYCRVSTTEQTKNLSLSTQERLCREYCVRERFDVAKVFVELGESAKTVQRTEFLALLAYCRAQKGKVHSLVVHSLTRFSRNTTDHHAIRALLAGLGISLRSVSERIDETPTGRFMETIFAGLAQLDNDMRAERTVLGMREAVSRGRWVWTAPLGYRSTRNKLGPSLEPDPERAPLVRRAFELYAEGSYTRPELLQALTSLGLRSRNGNALSVQSLHNPLRNPIYMGRIRSAGWESEYEGDFQPIVPESLFLRVQARLSSKTTSEPSRTRDDPRFPLRRFVRCETCGTPP